MKKAPEEEPDLLSLPLCCQSRRDTAPPVGTPQMGMVHGFSARAQQ